MHKRNFSLSSGDCLNDADYQIHLFEARENPLGDEIVQVLLPPADDLDAVLGTDKWLIRQAESEALVLDAASQIDFVSPRVGPTSCGATCGDSKLEW